MTDAATVVSDKEQIVAKESESFAMVAREARSQYESVRGLYDDYARSVASILDRCLKDQSLTIHSITSRAKDADSFERKAAQASPDSPIAAKYKNPIEEITDKAGIRVTTYFLNTVDQVAEIISEQFKVLEKIAKTSGEPERLGYQSTHYLVSYSAERIGLPEYRRFTGLTAEIQVRTILQHAWAEIEHDIQYKAIAVLPVRIRRRFATLAGLIEIADREFQAIENENREILREARKNVDLGHLGDVEITPDSIRAYLDKKYSPDGRMSDFSYEWTTRVLLELGFTSLAEVDECVRPYDDDAVSRILHNSRRGQLSRFEDVMLASMGESYIKGHRWNVGQHADHTLWYAKSCLVWLQKLRTAGISIGTYRPAAYPDQVLRDEVLESVKNQLRSTLTPPELEPEPDPESGPPPGWPDLESEPPPGWPGDAG